MKKKLLSILVLLILVAFSFDYALAATGEDISDNTGNNEAAESFVYTNPVYEDVITEEEILKDTQENTGASLRNGLSRQVDYSQFEEDEDVIVETLREAMTDHQENIQLLYRSSGSIGSAQVKRWMEMAFSETDSPVQGDYIRFVVGGSTCTINTEEESGAFYNTIDMNVAYYTTFEQEQELTAELNTVMDSFNFTESTSDYKKIETIYNYICENVTYDYENLNDDSYLLKYTAYAALMNKTAVCQGYAVLLYRMLKTAGVDARVISGTGLLEKHGWNIARIGELYYYLDSTWDAGNIYYSYFLRGSSTFPNHESDSMYLEDEFINLYPISENNYISPEDRIIVSGNFNYQISHGKATLLKYTGNDAEVTVPSMVEDYPVITIDSLAFYECDSLERLTLSEGIKNLMEESIFGCEALKELNIPASLSIPVPNTEGALTGFSQVPSHCSNLQTINVAPDSNYLTVIDGVLFDKELTCLFYYPSKKADSSYTIPDGVRIIGNRSFEGNRYLKKVSMPDTVTFIGYFAFFNVEQLKEINISQECKIIAQNALGGTAVEKIELPATLKIIMLDWSRYTQLKEWIVDEDNQIFSSDEGVLFNKGKDTIFHIPEKKEGEYTVPDSVTSIDIKAAEFSNLSKITIPAFTTIGSGNFSEHLKDLIICGYEDSPAERFAEWNRISFVSLGEPQSAELASGVCGDTMTWSLNNLGVLRISGTGSMSWEGSRPWAEYKNRIDKVIIEDGPEDIRKSAFSGIKTLSEIVLPQSIRKIGAYAFDDCNNLKIQEIPEGVEEIGIGAFAECDITKLILPSSLQLIGEAAFYNCRIKSISVKSDNQYFISENNVLFDKDMKKLVLYPQGDFTGAYHIPDGVETVGAYAFANSMVDAVYCPDTVQTIEKNAFEASHIKHVDLGDEVRQIGREAFSSCFGVHSMVIGDQLNEIGANAFVLLGKYNFKKIYFKGTASEWDSIDIDQSNLRWIIDKIEYNAPDVLCDQNIHVFQLVKNYKEPTCTEDGNRKYYQCLECGKLFEYVKFGDEAADCEITEDEIILPGGHQYGDWVETIAPTCTEAGRAEQECLKCGEKNSEEIPATGHDYTTSLTNPTCTEDGYSEQKCLKCGNTEVEVIPALGHTEVEISGKEATCTESGLTPGRKCTRCNKVTEPQTMIPALGHTEVEIPGKKATCTEPGLTSGKKCSVCGEITVVQDGIPALGHTAVSTPGKEATCTEPGLTAEEKCSVCGEILVPQVEIPAFGHIMTESIPGKDATCTEPGSTAEEKCMICGLILEPQVEIPATGHHYIEWNSASPSCTEEGYTEQKCENCGDIVVAEKTPALGHIEVDIPGEAATCTEFGWSAGKKCSRCGVVIEKQEIIPATGHKYGVVSKTDPTCTEDGSIEKKCGKCGDTVKEVVRASGHEIIELPEVEATCTEPGLTAGRKCSRCGSILEPQETVPAHGHAELYLPGVEATCTEPGMTYGKKCCLCDEILVSQETIPAMGHEWTDAVSIDKEPTCTEPGQSSIHCAICGEIKSGTVEEIPATAHAYGEWKTIMAATVNTEGSRERVCSVCGHKETEAIEKLPANDQQGEEQEEQHSDKPADTDKPQADTDKSEEPQKGGTTPADDPERMYGADGTAVGKGASAEAAEKAITSLKSDNDPAGSAFAPLLLKSTKQTKTSIKLTWRKVTGAEKYVIYGNACGKTKKFRKLTTASGSSKTVRKAAGRKLKKGTYYKFMVVALDSNNKVISTSKMIHVATKGKDNHTKLTTKAKNNKVTLKKGKTFKLGAKAIGKNVRKHAAVRYESSNPKVAKVSKSGKITAKKKGKCYVYAYAQNGVFKKIKVTVK